MGVGALLILRVVLGKAKAEGSRTRNDYTILYVCTSDRSACLKLVRLFGSLAILIFVARGAPRLPEVFTKLNRKHEEAFRENLSSSRA